MRANCDFTEYKHDKNQGIYGKNQRYPLLERMENQETDLSTTLKTEYMEATVMSATAPVQKQQGLNQVVINKVRRMIEGRQRDVMDTINRLLSEGRIAQDFIAPIGVSQRSKEHPVISFKAEGRVQMAMPEGNFNLHGNAISQISEKMGIPAKYLRELSAGDVWQKQLCATILNEHSGWTERTRVLIRAVGIHCLGHPFGGLLQPFACGILAQQPQYFGVVVL